MRSSGRCWCPSCSTTSLDEVVARMLAETTTRSCCWISARYLSAAVLVVAAVSRTMRPAPLAITTDLILAEGWGFTLTTVEVALAGWLASGAARRAASRVAQVAFGGFATVAAYKLLAGESSCG